MSRIGTTNIKMSDIRTELRTPSIGGTNVKLTDYYRNSGSERDAPTKSTGLANSYRHIYANKDADWQLPPGGGYPGGQQDIRRSASYARTTVLYRIHSPNNTFFHLAAVVNNEFPMVRTWKWGLQLNHTETTYTDTSNTNPSYGPGYGTGANTDASPWQGFNVALSGDYHYNTPSGSDMGHPLGSSWPVFTPGGTQAQNQSWIDTWLVSSNYVDETRKLDGLFNLRKWTNIYVLCRVKGDIAYDYPGRQTPSTLNSSVPAKPATGNTEISFSDFIYASNDNLQVAP
jgi:hypothetical protein